MDTEQASLSALSDLRWRLMSGGAAVYAGAKDADYTAAFSALDELEETVRQLRGGVLDVMRDSGMTWQEIGTYLGISRQAAQQRHRELTS